MNPPAFKLIVIRSTDIDRVATFYRFFGMDFQVEQHGSGPRHFAVELGGTVFEIYPAKKPEDVDRTTRLGFSVRDLHSTMASIRELGATIVDEPSETEWGQRAVVRDPDGRSVEL